MSIDAKDLKKVLKWIDRMESRLGNLKPLMKKTAQREMDRTDDRFLRAEDPDGNPWADLDSATLERKITNIPLFETGELFNSIDFRATNKGFEIGSDSDYAEYHQFGTDTIPARPFLGYSEEALFDDVEWIMTTIIENR